MEIKDVYRGDVAPNDPHLIWIRGTEILLFGKDGWQPLSGSLSTLEELLSEDSVNPIQNRAVYNQYVNNNDIDDVLMITGGKYRDMPLTFEVINAAEGRGTIHSGEYEVEFKKNDSAWIKGSEVQVKTGDIIQIRKASTWFNSTFSTEDCTINISGNIMSLIDPIHFSSLESIERETMFGSIFASCDIYSAKNLCLPAAILSKGCYYRMFADSSIVEAPKVLPAITLARGCYEKMFDNCVNLITTPVLLGENLAEGCYSEMFSGCKLIKEAPKLIATKMAKECYSCMFYGCINLITAPELNSTKLEEGCYDSMFSGCTQLVNAPKLPATTLAKTCYRSMFSECESLRNAPELPALIMKDGCYDSMFSGCASLVSAPKLPAIVLATSCYYGMFVNCTLLQSAPELPAKELVEQCYAYMFKDCSNLNYIKCLATENLSGALYSWTSGVSETGTFVKDKNAEFSEGTNGIPEGWEIEEIEEKDYSIYPLTFTAIGDGDFIIDYNEYCKDNEITRDIQYSYNNGAWITWDGEEPINIHMSEGDTIRMRGDNECVSYWSAEDDWGYGLFNWSEVTAPISISGNIMSLMSRENFENLDTVPDGGFMEFFADDDWEWSFSALIDAKNLSLPAKSVGYYGYSGMFIMCHNLITPPALPATILGEYCYYDMFDECYSLTIAPDLPAIELSTSCYEDMFYSCISLQLPPKIMAEIAAENCCHEMFSYCRSLITPPELSITTLAENCYNSMFQNCESLITAPELSVTILKPHCYTNMFSGCIYLEKMPDLPATTLEEGCYYDMFYECKSLTVTKPLPAKELVKDCYSMMFYHCSNLKEIYCYAESIDASNCLYRWVRDVPNNGIFHKDIDTEYSVGDDGIPEGWEIIND